MTPPQSASRQQQQYGLAAFGRRVPDLGEGNARRNFYAKPSKLPEPDGYWSDGKPWWWESTVDAYARSRGKPVPADARWPFNWPIATTPTPLRPVFEVPVPSYGGQSFTVSVLVYDTPQAPVAYVLRHQLDISQEVAAAAAAKVLAPADWPAAIVLVADFRMLGSTDDLGDADIYRLVPRRRTAPAAAGGGSGLLGRLKAELGWGGAAGEVSDEPDTAPTDVAEISARHDGVVFTRDVAAVLGRPLPMWVDFTCNPITVREALAYGDSGPIVAADTSTVWPAVRGALAALVDLGAHIRYPQAFALLAAAAVGTLNDLQNQLAAILRGGEGWYLAAVPAAPSWPLDLEHTVRTAADQPFACDAAVQELAPLRAEAAGLPWDHPAGGGMQDAADMLAYRLRETDPGLAHAAPRRERLETAGPVTSQYLAGLTRLSDDQTRALLAQPTRRVAALITGERATGSVDAELLRLQCGRVIAFYQALDGTYTAEFRPDDPAEGDHDLAIEWPAVLPQGWTGDTRIAADDYDTGPKLVVALTPRPEGGLHVDLLPNPGHDPGYTWGYSGGGPRTLYTALIRCATNSWDHPLTSGRWNAHLAAHPEDSDLYHAIVTHQGDLRLTWPDIQRHAKKDLAALKNFLKH